MQQSLAMVLGVINYNNHPKAVAKAFEYLLGCLKPKVSSYRRVSKLLFKLRTRQQPISKRGEAAYRLFLEL